MTATTATTADGGTIADGGTTVDSTPETAPTSGQSQTPDEMPAPGPLKRLFVAHPWWFGIIAALLFVPLIRPFTRHEPDPPPVYGALPAFALADQDGAVFTRDAMAGKVWVATFFFSSCPTLCTDLIGQQKALHDRFAEAKVPVTMVSITVDPETDTSDHLRAYATKLGVNVPDWRFVTGDESAIRGLVVDGFRTAMGDRAPQSDDLYDIAHSTKFVLVDGAGNVRGYFGSDDQGIDEVFHRSQHVMKEAKAP